MVAVRSLSSMAFLASRFRSSRAMARRRSCHDSATEREVKARHATDGLGPVAAGGEPGARVTRSGWQARRVSILVVPEGGWWIGWRGAWFEAME